MCKALISIAAATLVRLACARLVVRKSEISKALQVVVWFLKY